VKWALSEIMQKCYFFTAVTLMMVLIYAVCMSYTYSFFTFYNDIKL